MAYISGWDQIAGRTYSYEETNFTAADSPRVLDVNTDLGRNTKDGYIVVDGVGDLLVEISDNGTDYGGQHTLKTDERLLLTNIDVDSIRLTHSGVNTAYRILVV